MKMSPTANAGESSASPTGRADPDRVHFDAGDKAPPTMKTRIRPTLPSVSRSCRPEPVRTCGACTIETIAISATADDLAGINGQIACA